MLTRNCAFSLNTLLQDDTRDTERFSFLDALDAWSKLNQQKRFRPAIAAWISSCRRSMVGSGHNMKLQDQEFYIQLAVNEGSVTFIRDRYEDIAPRCW